MPRKKVKQTLRLPLIPLRGLMVFPHMVLHFDVGRVKSTAALEKASGHLLNVTDVDGELVYSNTAMGIKAAKDLGAALPLSVRDKMFKEAVRVYTRDAMKRNRSFLGIDL